MELCNGYDGRNSYAFDHFIKYYIDIPSIAAVECLFSIGNDILQGLESHPVRLLLLLLLVFFLPRM